jgi:hypothetical protein
LPDYELNEKGNVLKNTLSSARVEILEKRRMLSASLGWGLTVGGSGKDRGDSVAVDSSGNSYIAGVYNGPVDFDPTAKSTVLPGSNSDDGYIAKYSPTGQLLWASAVSATGLQEVQAVTVDALGDVYATGWFNGTVTFGGGTSVATLTSHGGADGFVLKLTSGGSMVWVRQLGGASDDGGVAVAADNAGNVYSLGIFTGTGDYDPGPGTATLTNNGGYDIYLSKLSPAGAYLFADKFGGSGAEFANGVAVDSSGNIVIDGTFSNTVDFDPGSATHSLSSAGGADVFVAKLNAANQFVFADRFGSAGTEIAGDIKTDPKGNIFFDGGFSGTVDFNPSPQATATLSASGSTDAFVSELNSAGALVWANRIGGNGSTCSNDLSLDASDNVYITGRYTGTTDFDPSSNTYKLSSAGGSQDIFVEKLASNGAFSWALGFGSTSNDDEGEGIAADPRGGVMITGSFGGTVDFQPGSSVWNQSAPGSAANLYLLRLV